MNKWNMLVVNEKLSKSVCLAPTPEKIEEYKLYKKHFNELYEEIERLNKELEELKHIMYIIRDDNGLNHLWCKDIILKWLKGDGSNEY